jgi:iron(III) transport system substrate-binding protein
VAKHAKNRDHAVQFMKFLASDFAQDYFANGNNEYPAAKGVVIDNPALNSMGGKDFKRENIPQAAVARNLTKVQQMLDRVGYK